MKKYKTYLIVIIIVMLIPILIKTFTRSHSVEYKVNGYNISEKFYMEDNIHKYEFKISNKNGIITNI